MTTMLAAPRTSQRFQNWMDSQSISGLQACVASLEPGDQRSAIQAELKRRGA